MAEIVQYALDAISQGFLYALLALSLALVFSVMNLVNFAHGELIMIAGYTMYLTRDDLPWPLVIVAVLLVVMLSAVLMERVAFRPVRAASATTLLVTSFAVSALLQVLARMIFGTLPKGVEPYSVLTDSIVIGTVRIPWLDVVTIGACTLMIVALALLLNRTELGIQLRAATEDFTMARLLGVNANRVIACAFAITGVLAGVTGLILVSRVGVVSPTMGTLPVLIAFVGIVIGGMGTLTGPAIGGFLLGAADTLLRATLPTSIGDFTTAFAFAGVILILVIRPQGLIPSRQQVRV
ncbi:MAG TPA: branched-chain amino acid ABC transporter permease [Conexibacter sp.]|nr:branched-chain amino acid ABC transporter permease [Conexibacter sp.]